MMQGCTSEVAQEMVVEINLYQITVKFSEAWPVCIILEILLNHQSYSDETMNNKEVRTEMIYRFIMISLWFCPHQS